MQIAGFHHMTIPVPDIERSSKWYCRILHGEEYKRTGWDQRDVRAGRTRQIFIRAGDAVVNLAEGDPIRRREEVHFWHYAFRAGTGDMDAWMDHLENEGVQILGPYGHGGSGTVSLYFDDPDGYRLEIVFEFPDHESAKAEAVKRGGKLGNPNNEYSWE